MQLDYKCAADAVDIYLREIYTEMWAVHLCRVGICCKQRRRKIWKVDSLGVFLLEISTIDCITPHDFYGLIELRDVKIKTLH